MFLISAMEQIFSFGERWRLCLVERNISSFTSWKYLYHCTHKHSLFVYEELISKTSYIHSYILLICSSGHSQKSKFSTQNLLLMENVDTNWNLEQKISKNSNSTLVRTVFWPCHKFWAYIKKNKGIKSRLVPKPLLSALACHSFPLLITL